jgi:hypothetical protein
MTVTLPTRLLESFCLGFVQVESSKLEAAYHRADKAIQQIVDLLAA